MIKHIKNRYYKLKNAHKKAFSILEVVIVIGVVAVLSYISIASMTATKGNVNADKQMQEVKDVFLATDTIIGDYWDIEEARDELFPIGAPEELLIGELVEYTVVPRAKLADYTFGIDSQNRLVVKYKEFTYNGADNYMPNGGNVATTTPPPSDIEIDPSDESFIPIDTEWSGDRDGEFKYIGSKTTVVIPHTIKGVKVTSYKGMFEGTKVNKVISNNTNVTDMSYMFKDTKATTLDLSNLDTAGVTLMNYMFTDSTKNNETKLTSLDLTGFNTINVVDMEGMFYRSKITTLDVTGFNTSKVVNTSYMFARDDSFTSQPVINHINLGTFDMSNVFNMRNMFKGANEILGYAKSTADAAKLNGSHNKPANLRFIVIANDNDFKWVKDNTIGYTMDLEEGKGYYQYKGGLTEIAMPRKIKGQHVTSYAGMFSNTNVDKVVSASADITDMSRMFWGSKAPTIYMNRINTKNVTKMSGMFGNALTTNIDLTNIDTNNVFDMSQMFYNSKALTLNLKNIKTSKVVNASEMFAGYQGEELKLTGFDMSKASNVTDMFKGAKSVRGYAYSQADANRLNASSNKPSYLHFVILAMDEDFDWIQDSTNGYTMSGQSGVGYWRYNGPAIEIELPNQIYGVPVRNYNRMFINSPVIQVDSYNPNVTDMSGMFYNSIAPKLDLRKVNTLGAVNMEDMFNGAKAVSFDLTNFNSNRVTNTSGMFANTIAKQIDISKINTANVTDMSRMFQRAAITEIDADTIITTKVTNMSNMFEGFRGTVLNLESFRMNTVSNTSNMFLNTAARTGYAGSQDDADKLNASSSRPKDLFFVVRVKDEDFSGRKNGEFKYIGKAIHIEVPHVIWGVNVTSYKGMFEGTLVSKVSSTNKNITDMSYMFQKSRATSLDLSSLYTNNVVTMKSMFDTSSALTIDRNGFNTAKVTDMSGMFKNSSVLSNNLTSLNTSLVRDMSDIFNGSKATSIIINKNNTASVTNMSGAFESSAIKGIDLNGLNISNVVNLDNTFKNSSFTTLDVSSLNTSKVTSMVGTFEGTVLSDINISSWNTSRVVNATGMFKNSRALLTGINTMNTSSLTNASSMFAGNKTINNLDLSRWNTSLLANTSSMFEDATGLVDLDLRWNTARLSNITNMFRNVKIPQFNLESWDTSALTSTSNAFLGTTAKIGYARTQTDANKLNASAGKPAHLIFGVKSTVKFIDQGNTVANLTIATGNPIQPIPATPSRTGYTFRGWFTVDAASGGKQFINGANVVGNETYYARWTINSYTFTFNSQEGSTASPASITKNYNEAIGALPTTSRAGHDFLGWFTAPTGGTKLTTTTRVGTSNMTYYAQWKIQTRTYRFLSEGGTGASPVDTITKDYGSVIGTLPTSTRAGYTFEGWYTSQTGGTKLLPTEKMNDTKHFYARWAINNKTFSFNGNGGSGASSVTKPHGQTIGTLPTSSREGYTFLGWYTSTSGGSKLATNTAMTSDTTYYANWSIIRNTLTVNPNGGVFQESSGTKSITGDYGTDTIVGRPTRTGHTFSHWSQSGSGSVAAYGKHTPGRSNDHSAGYWNSMNVYNNRGNGTTTATWTGLGGTNPVNPSWPNQVMRIKSVGTDQSPGRGGFYQGTNSSANRVYYHVIVATIPEGVYINDYRNAIGDGGSSTWLTSKYGTGKPETYIYRVNTGSGGSFSSFGHVAAVGGPSTLTWDVHYAHMFDATGANGDFNNSELFKFDNKGSKTLTANWTANNYTVTFEGNGAANSTRSVAYGSEVGALPTPSKEGHTFQGWATAQTGGSWVNENYVPNGNVTYYARWTVNPYTVAFNGNGGAGYASRSVNYGAAVGWLPTPARTGYDFQGWATHPTGGSWVNTGTTVWGNTTYYARWTIKRYTVTVNTNGLGSEARSFTVNHGSTIGSSFDLDARRGPSYGNYRLVGFGTGSNHNWSNVRNSTVITSNTTVYAHWLIRNNGRFKFTSNQPIQNGEPWGDRVDYYYNGETVNTMTDIKEWNGYIWGTYLSTASGNPRRWVRLKPANGNYYGYYY